MLDKTISFTIQELLICLLILAGIVALIFLIRLFNKLGNSVDTLGQTLKQVNVVLDDVDKTMKELDGMLDDAKGIIATAQKATDDTQQIIRKARKSLTDISNTLSVNKSKLGAAFNVVNAGASLFSLFHRNSH